MKNKILFFFGSVIFILLALILFFIYPSKTTNDTNTNIISEKTLIDGNFLNSNYKKNTNRILLFASIDCDFCEKTLNYIEENKTKLFSKFQLILVFNENEENIQSYLNKNSTLSSPLIFIYQDKGHILGSKLNITAFPTLFILDGEQIINKAQGLDDSKNLISQAIKF